MESSEEILDRRAQALLARQLRQQYFVTGGLLAQVRRMTV
jgi:hypothetical protein